MANFRSSRGLTTALLVVLPIYLLAGAASNALTEVTSVQTSQGWRVNANSPLSAVPFLLFVALAVLTPIWALRVHRNAEAISGTKLKGAAGWTAGAWFIPLAGGALAAAPMARVLRQSRGQPAALPIAWGVGWSIYQAFVVAMMVVLMGVLFGQVINLGMEPTQAELERAEQALRDVLPFQWIVFAVEVLVGALMAAAILRIQAVQDISSQRPLPPSIPPTAPPPGWTTPAASWAPR